MDEKNTWLHIRSALIPVFFQKFHCLAQACRDNCCVHGWGILFDKKDYLRLRRLDAPPALRERLKQGVRREKKIGGYVYGKFDLDPNNGCCPFFDEDGLCTIQRACGHDALPDVCRSYPRKVVYTPAAREYCLSPSCEGVLQELWDLPDGVEFVEDPLPETECMSFNISLDDNLQLYFTPVRGLFIDILQNRAMSLTERMLCLGVIIRQLQKEDWNSFDPDRWVEQTAPTVLDAVKEMDIPRKWNMYMTQNLKTLDGIAASKERSWINEIYNALEIERKVTTSVGENGVLDENTTTTLKFSEAAYAGALAQFQEAFSDREYFFENLMVAVALYTAFPKLSSKEALWESYVSLCDLYSIYRFVSVSGCKGEATKERLFHMIVMASRETLHNKERFNGFQEQLFKNDSSTLAHMAILLRWD